MECIKNANRRWTEIIDHCQNEPNQCEHDLEARVITLLGTVPDYYSTPTFSPIPAIKHAKDVMGWDLWTSKEYVEKIYKKNLDKIEAARVSSLKSWKAEHEDDAHV